jgi:hypothetical protein
VEISYTTPLRRAWQHMRAMLFHPLHLERWLVIGFAAFLANLFDTGGGLYSWKTRGTSLHEILPEAGRRLEAVREQALVLLDKPIVLFAIAFGLVVFGVLLLVFAWLSARARFVFLDDVVTGRSEFVEPWNRTGRLGRSLFLWFAAFSFAWLLPIGVVAMPFAHGIESLLRGDGFVAPPLLAMVLHGVAAGALAVLLTLVGFLTRQFVVPLMLLHDESATRAWARFWPLFTSHLGEFIAYILFVAVVWIGVGVTLAVAGVATCCIGLVLMVIPYVGTVLLLPIEVTARAYGPMFLAQYGPEWDLFAARAPKAVEPGGPLLGGPLPGGPLPGGPLPG